MTGGEKEQPKPNGGEGRDAQGRFVKGNRGGPGNPYAQKATEFRQAAMSAIQPEHVAAILRKVAKRALEGDLRAARLVLERVLGKPSQAAGEAAALAIELPSLDTPTGCLRATEVVLNAMCAGELPAEAARTLLDAINVRNKALETVDLEARLRELEARMASKADSGRRRRS